MRDAVICEPLRTPVGRFGGALREVPAETLAAEVVRALLTRTGLPPDAVDDVILGQAYPGGEAPAIGRVVALDAGLGIGGPGPAGRPQVRLRVSRRSVMPRCVCRPGSPTS
jgi:acetyl-CoA C-acetyltransferase